MIIYYLSELISVIVGSRNTLEIALYGLDDFDVYQALQRASARGVQIRMLYENASTERKKNRRNALPRFGGERH